MNSTAPFAKVMDFHLVSPNTRKVSEFLQGWEQLRFMYSTTEKGVQRAMLAAKHQNVL